MSIMVVFFQGKEKVLPGVVRNQKKTQQLCHPTQNSKNDSGQLR